MDVLMLFQIGGGVLQKNFFVHFFKSCANASEKWNIFGAHLIAIKRMDDIISKEETEIVSLLDEKSPQSPTTQLGV